jgi:hypothetical protein
MIFRFKITFPGRPEFMREYDIDSEQTLYDFHHFIQSDLDYDEAQPVLFYTADAKWKEGREFSLFGNGGSELMDEVSVGSLVRAKNHRLLYTFDVINDRSLRLELQEMLEPMPRARYPRTASESGEPPAQIGSKGANPLSSIFDQAMPDFDASLYASPSGGDD